MGVRGIVGGAARQALAPVGGAARMAGATARDVVTTLQGGGGRDLLDDRDPDYIRETLPTIRAFCRAWFRGEVEGLEHIPGEGPVLLVGNHSGGIYIADTFVLAQAIYDHLGPERPFHQLAHDLVFQLPGLRALVTRWGTVPANPENTERALERGAALLVYPGGDYESFRPSWETAKVDFGGRKGFIKQALEHDAPIVPIVAIGGQETALFLGRGQRVARLLALDRRARLKVLPPVIGPPWGLNVMDLPGRIPLPAKIKLRVLPPVNLREELGEDPDLQEGYDLITRRMQDALDDLADERTLPVVG
jgi:1-acyl-sn-glycerol-3-phosphate acyltransferase